MIYVDIGNTRIKWRHYNSSGLTDSDILPTAEPEKWSFKTALVKGEECLIASVVPRVAVDIKRRLSRRGYLCRIASNSDVLENKIGFSTEVRNPCTIGIDRLLGSLAAWHQRLATSQNTVVIGIGTAMTVDFVRPEGVHVGGTILPGPRLMAQSLKNHTAMLPLVEIDNTTHALTFGVDTDGAIGLGIVSAIRGSADLLIRNWVHDHGPTQVFLTGGDSRIFNGFAFTAEVGSVTIVPDLILDGLRLIAGKMPWGES